MTTNHYFTLTSLDPKLLAQKKKKNLMQGKIGDGDGIDADI
jgi:hypothetical protein